MLGWLKSQRSGPKIGVSLFSNAQDGLRQAPNLLLAVSTPGGEKLHHPHIITLQHHLVKVVISELNHILLAATTAATTTLLEGSWVLLDHVQLSVSNFKTAIKSYHTGLLLPVPACCSQSCQTCHSACLSPDCAKCSWLHPQWPDYCVHLRVKKHADFCYYSTSLCMPKGLPDPGSQKHFVSFQNKQFTEKGWSTSVSPPPWHLRSFLSELFCKKLLFSSISLCRQMSNLQTAKLHVQETQLYLGTPLVCSYLLRRSWWWGNLSRHTDHPVTCAGLHLQHQPWQFPKELHNKRVNTLHCQLLITAKYRKCVNFHHITLTALHVNEQGEQTLIYECR